MREREPTPPQYYEPPYETPVYRDALDPSAAVAKSPESLLTTAIKLRRALRHQSREAGCAYIIARWDGLIDALSSILEHPEAPCSIPLEICDPLLMDLSSLPPLTAEEAPAFLKHTMTDTIYGEELDSPARVLMDCGYELTGAVVIRDDFANGNIIGAKVRAGIWVNKPIFFEERALLDGWGLHHQCSVLNAARAKEVLSELSQKDLVQLHTENIPEEIIPNVTRQTYRSVWEAHRI